jgi:hypothetical protein
MLPLLGCGKDGGKNPAAPGNTVPVRLTITPVASGIDEAFFFMTPMDLAPDGHGGFYFMDWDDAPGVEQQIFGWRNGEFYATGLTPSAILEAMGLTSAVGDFQDMDADGSGRLYFLLSYLDEQFQKALFYVDFEAEEMGYVIPPDVFSAILRSAGLTMDLYHYVRMRMLVTNEGSIWMVAADDEEKAAAFLVETGGSQVNVKHWPLPDSLSLYSYGDHELGPGRNGDLLITDRRHGILWRVTSQGGPAPYISLKGLPSTVSSFCERPDGALVFATNVDWDTGWISVGGDVGYVVDVIRGILADGTDRLIYLIPTDDGFAAAWWDTSDLMEPFVADGASPEFWQFWPDPADGSLWVADVAPGRGDVYRMTFQVEGP